MQRFSVPEMNCGGCVRGVTRAITGLDPEAVVEADLEAKTIAVSSRSDGAAIVEALKTAGFEAALAA
ncbi:MAG: heavy-metal-associated domain-containing protein [Caulobacteraceae bacterium]